MRKKKWKEKNETQENAYGRKKFVSFGRLRCVNMKRMMKKATIRRRRRRRNETQYKNNESDGNDT